MDPFWVFACLRVLSRIYIHHCILCLHLSQWFHIHRGKIKAVDWDDLDTFPFFWSVRSWFISPAPTKQPKKIALCCFHCPVCSAEYLFLLKIAFHRLWHLDWFRRIWLDCNFFKAPPGQAALLACVWCYRTKKYLQANLKLCSSLSWWNFLMALCAFCSCCWRWQGRFPFVSGAGLALISAVASNWQVDVEWLQTVSYLLAAESLCRRGFMR